ncbi:hypothetical protein CEXT_441511 [Caerostris extrusa]|uniref:Uncharacterized protein n=1 Tax=Caerostris extrusa TaxID=172846 RepID=A0AAV4XMX2_CAEEX|nr:hypothetical protein CEXT_441511 [Caerostris extrusa]
MIRGGTSHAEQRHENPRSRVNRRTNQILLHPTRRLRSDMNPLMGQRGLTDKYCISICHMLCSANLRENPLLGGMLPTPTPAHN